MNLNKHFACPAKFVYDELIQASNPIHAFIEVPTSTNRNELLFRSNITQKGWHFDWYVLKEAQPIFFGHAIAAMTAELSGRPLVHIQLFHTHHDVDPNFFQPKKIGHFILLFRNLCI